MTIAGGQQQAEYCCGFSSTLLKAFATGTVPVSAVLWGVCMELYIRHKHDHFLHEETARLPDLSASSRQGKGRDWRAR